MDDQASTSPAAPRLSACLIVRDEQEMLPGCIASIRDVVDEVVVADTGSRDATVRLAEEAGAVVIHHAWRDDFSAARNAALDASTGDWALVLDADERLVPGAGALLRAATLREDIDCVFVPLLTI